MDILKSESKIRPGHKMEVLETMIPQLLEKKEINDLPRWLSKCQISYGSNGHI